MHVKKKKLSKKRGLAMAEAILLIGISLVIVITVFYPQVKAMINDTILTISTWFKGTLDTIGI